MIDKRYRPGRRRKPLTAAVLDWAAGVLIGALITLLGSAVVGLVVEPGLARTSALVTTTLIVWPLGASLGVWLAMDRPLTARVFAHALGSTVLGCGVLLGPIWMGVDTSWVRGVSGIAALILAPAFARLGVTLARARSS
jgi:hypothetical protein